jgi:precorrin-3B synthase
VADEASAAELRITPWRGVVLAGLAGRHVDVALATLARADFIVAPADPALAVIACAGSSGCAAGLADTQRDGRRVVDLLRARPQDQRPSSVHLSGCEKRCASRRRSDLTLEAGPERGWYQVELGGGEVVGAVAADTIDAALDAVAGRSDGAG